MKHNGVHKLIPQETKNRFLFLLLSNLSIIHLIWRLYIGYMQLNNPSPRINEYASLHYEVQ